MTFTFKKILLPFHQRLVCTFFQSDFGFSQNFFVYISFCIRFVSFSDKHIFKVIGQKHSKS